jgi:hypothetical protein
MLIGNGRLIHKIPLSLTGMHWTMFSRDEVLPDIGLSSGFGDLASIPSGYNTPKAIVMPITAGGMSSYFKAAGSCTVSLTMAKGRNISGTSDGAATVAATLQLIVSMTGAASGVATAQGNLLAVLLMSGTIDGSSTASATVGALAWCYGSVAGSSTASLVSYATGRLYGSIYVNESQATVDQIVTGIWDAQTDDHDLEGSMGAAVKAAGTAGDPWTANLDDYKDTDSAGYHIKQKLLTTSKFLGLK